MDIFETWLARKPIAHRGLHNDLYPENSIGAFRNAIENGYAVSLEIRALDDGTVIVFHDETLGRMTNTDGYVSKLKAADIAELKLGKSEEHIPTLKEVLNFVAGRTPLLLELRSNSCVGAFEKTVVELLDSYQGDFAVASFNPYALEFFKLNAPHFLRGQISGNFPDKSIPLSRRLALKHMIFNKKISCPHFIAYDFRALPSPYVARYRKRSVPVIAWTIRSNDDYERVKKFCDNILFERYSPEEKK